MDRREFTRELMAGAMAAPIALRNNTAQTATAQDPVAASLEDQLIAMLQSQFANRLTEEQWKQVRSKINGQLAAAKSLREFKLLNSDEPATIFAARGPS
jgi:hypothetical protein